MAGEQGPRKGPSWGKYRSGGIGGSHPGIEVPDLPPGVMPISHSPRGLRKPGGGTLNTCIHTYMIYLIKQAANENRQDKSPDVDLHYLSIK